MCVRKFLKEIHGTVFHDTGNDHEQKEEIPFMKGVGIDLFLVTDKEIKNDSNSEITIYREKQICRTTTNDKGEFCFIVHEGTYCIKLDTKTLPSGKGVRESSRLLHFGENENIGFAVNDVSSQSIDRNKTRLDNRSPGLCSADKIRLACKLGIIDENLKIKYLTYAIHQSSKLPKEYRSAVPIKSGTGILEELNHYIKSKSADPSIREAARQVMSSSIPELDKAYRSPSGYFNIHYTLEGEHAVDFNRRDYRAVPPYITQVGEAFDNARAITCHTRGFREPVLDEGKNTYDIYVYDLKDKYGITYSSKLHSARHFRSVAASSFICIDNSYSKQKGFDKGRLECMKVTAAHEFFHAVQFAYNAEADTWWKEASATWNEDEIYTGINDYVRYIESYFKTPYKSLDETSYSGVIFVKFLAENYGGYKTIRKIWEMQSAGYDNSIQAIDWYLRTSFPGKDIGTIYNQFSAYNTNPAQYYKEGAAWNISVAAQNTHVKYPVSMNVGLLNHLSSNYQLFKPGDLEEGKSLRIALEGADGARWGFQLQKRNSMNKLYSNTQITSRGNFDRAEIDLEGFGTAFDEVWLIPANLETEHDRMPYTYSADLK